jgi:hypothetical protein
MKANGRFQWLTITLSLRTVTWPILRRLVAPKQNSLSFAIPGFKSLGHKSCAA